MPRQIAPLPGTNADPDPLPSTNATSVPMPGANPNAAGNLIANAETPKTGFDRYLEQQLNLAGTRELDGGSSKGFVYSSGPYRGMTKGQAIEKIRAGYSAMPGAQKDRFTAGAYGRDVMTPREITQEKQYYNARGVLAGAPGAVGFDPTRLAGSVYEKQQQPDGSGIRTVDDAMRARGKNPNHDVFVPGIHDNPNLIGGQSPKQQQPDGSRIRSASAMQPGNNAVMLRPGDAESLANIQGRLAAGRRRDTPTNVIAAAETQGLNRRVPLGGAIDGKPRDLIHAEKEAARTPDPVPRTIPQPPAMLRRPDATDPVAPMIDAAPKIAAKDKASNDQFRKFFGREQRSAAENDEIRAAGQRAFNRAITAGPPKLAVTKADVDKARQDITVVGQSEKAGFSMTPELPSLDSKPTGPTRVPPADLAQKKKGTRYDVSV